MIGMELFPHIHWNSNWHWTAQLADYLNTKWEWNNPALNIKVQLYRCPNDGGPGGPDIHHDADNNGYYVAYSIHQLASQPPFAFNPHWGKYDILYISRFKDPSKFLLFADSRPKMWGACIAQDWGSMTGFRHMRNRRLANAVFLDGRAESIQRANFGERFYACWDELLN